MTTKNCDICNKKINSWEDMAGHLDLKMFQSSQNLLANLNFSNKNYQNCHIIINDLCYDCQRIISKKLYQSLENILGKRGIK